jgi:signal transduction histidine kinase/CheY-like chemotaxis protein/HAMP domain-containing protein
MASSSRNPRIAAASRAADEHTLGEVVTALQALAAGDFSIRLPARRTGAAGEVARAYNHLASQNEKLNRELSRVGRRIGRDGRLGERVDIGPVTGAWRERVETINGLIDDLARPTAEVARVISAVAAGDLTQTMTMRSDGQPERGEFLRISTMVNGMVDQLSSFAAEVTRVAREVGTEGQLGGQAHVRGVSGTWKDLTDNVNLMASNLTSQVRNISQVATAVAEGDLSRTITVDAKGEVAALADTINSMTGTLRSFADEVTRVAREVGTEGKLGGQATVPGVAGTWKDLTDNVNQLAGNLTTQVRNIAQVTTAVARGDLTQKITVDARGEILELKDTMNTMVDQLSAFADEVTRVAREVGTEGKLGGQAGVPGVAGTWKDLTDNVNQLAGNLTTQVRNISQVTTAVARGDLTQKITVDARGEILELKDTMNTMVDQLSAFADEVTRVAREVGTEGKLGGQATVRGVSGTWKELTDNVNQLAGNLTTQVRNIAQVTTAVARGDLTQKISVDARGEILELKNTINTMVDQLSAFADEVTRVAREVGTDGKLGGQATVRGVSGTWKELTANVNSMADNLTDQVRNIAQVTTAVANGDLTQKITVGARGEILELKNTINTMVDQLSAFAAEVTRVAREVGTEGKLGGQAEVEGVSGTWKRLTENVNQLAGNLTTQVRAIAQVSRAVTMGDLTRSITVDAPGEVGDLKDTINQMIANLAETTRVNTEQDWLKTNLARISAMLQGQRDLSALSDLIMRELTPLVVAQHGAFFLAEQPGDEPGELHLIASYGYTPGPGHPRAFALGEGLVGQAAKERRIILVSDAPADYIRVSSGLGESVPVNIVVLPIVFEDQVLAVVELASLKPFSDINRQFLEQIVETLGVVLSTIIANTRTEHLLGQSQRLAEELQHQSRELQSQQDELKRSNLELEEQAQSLKVSEELLQAQQDTLQHTNAELEVKADQLATQNRAIEIQNAEIELARRSLEEKAEQLAVSSRYKSEFLANMSHELRTPLNSLLILAKLLADNAAGNLDDKQVEFARSIHAAGHDLLQLISDILDLSKIEAGKMDVSPAPVHIAAVCDDVRSTFGPLAEDRGLDFRVTVEGVPGHIVTDEQRLQQVLKNLLSNALKFTEIGSVSLTIAPAPATARYHSPNLRAAVARAAGADDPGVVAFRVSDTGIGIAADKLLLIFEAFQQADGTTSRRFGGTGLGLSISREIAGLLGGEIQVQSAEGHGSTFTLFVPTALPTRSARTGAATTMPMLPPMVGRPGGLIDQLDTQPEDAPTTALGTDELAAYTVAAGDEPMPVVELDPDLVDDRDRLGEGDRILLMVSGDPDLAGSALGLGHRQGFKVLVALRGDTGLALAGDHRPDAIVLDTQLPNIDGLALLEALKRQPTTRHIPVHVVAARPGDDDAVAAQRRRALAAGAFAYSEKPLAATALDAALADIGRFISRDVRHLLVVEDDDLERSGIVSLLAGDDVAVTGVATSEAALDVLSGEPVDCMVLDLKLPRMSGFDLLDHVRNAETGLRGPNAEAGLRGPNAETGRHLPVVVYTGRDLNRREEDRLAAAAEAVIVKDARSPERLLDETALFLHRVEARLPADKRRMIQQLHTVDDVFRGRHILVVDDDVRNVFALTSALEERGMRVSFAENGRDGIDTLKAAEDVDLVLMDIMMPGLDGYETTRIIRTEDRYAKLPIIALTAKAMKGDRERCIAAGASDYITKPVDIEQLLALMRVWLYH